MKNKLWTKDEIDFILSNYEYEGTEYCAKYLNRTIIGVRKKAKQLNIKSLRIDTKYKKNNIEPIVNESKNLTECLQKMGLRNAGGNFIILKKYIKMYNLNTNHFETVNERIKRTYSKKNKISLNELLVENCKHSRSCLKNRLLKEKY